MTCVASFTITAIVLFFGCNWLTMHFFVLSLVTVWYSDIHSSNWLMFIVATVPLHQW
jgi:hypothetical protein